MTRIALVSGAVGGIGTSICEALYKQGRTVIGTYRDGCREKAESWLAEQSKVGVEVTDMLPVDVSDFESCSELFNIIKTKYGNVEILVNNAGITRDGTLKNMDSRSWNEVINTNLNSMFNMTKPIFQTMCEGKWGRIINISSINAQKGQFGQANYSAAKAGMHGFTKSIALEGARFNVTVNTVSPGYIATKMVMSMPDKIINNIISSIPVNRLGLPYEISRCVSFLSHDDAGYITGSELSVNGGQYLK